MIKVLSLRELWDAREAARERYEHLGATNTSGRTRDQAFELDVAYRRAQQEFLDADQKYGEAIRQGVE